LRDEEGRRDSFESNSSRSSSLVGLAVSPALKRKREGKDEKIAREKGVSAFMSVQDIINIPMDEFNESLERYKQTGVHENGNMLLMTDDQAVLAREIRRRGKNKNAAQDCRKRANTRIDNLKKAVNDLREQKNRLQQEYSSLIDALRVWKNKNELLQSTILKQMDFDPDHWMLEDDASTGTVNFAKIPQEIIQGPPPMIPLSQPPVPSLTPLDRPRLPVLPSGATLHKVSHVPASHPYTIYRPRPQLHPASGKPFSPVSLYPAIQQAPLLPSVSLFPVSYADRFQSFHRGDIPPSPPALLERERQMFEGVPMTTMHEQFRGGFIEEEPSIIIKEEQPEDLSIVSENDVAVVDEINRV